MKFLNTYNLRQKPRLGNTVSGADEFENLNNKLLKTVKGFDAAGVAFGQSIDKINQQNTRLSAGLGVVAENYEKVNTEGLKLVKTITYLEEHNKELNDTLKVNSVAAGEIAKRFRDVGSQVGFSDKTINKYVKGVSGMVGTTLLASNQHNDFIDSMIQGQAIMQESIGLSAEQAEGFEQYSNSLGTTSTATMQALKGLAKSFADQTGGDALAIQAEIMGEIGSLSEETQLQYGRMPGNLETAVLKAKALGMTMENLKQTGEKLLDVEQSVGDELEYQLLSGQRLVKNGKSLTNEYRMAFMEGNGEKQAEIMNDILKSQGETLNKNYMARKKMSDLLGIDEKTLARSLNKQKIAAAIGAEQLNNLQGKELNDEIETLKKNFKGSPEEYKAYVKKLNEFKEQTDTRTSHEKNMEKGQLLIANLIAKQGNLDIQAASDAADAGFDSLQGVRDIYAGNEELVGYAKMTGQIKDTYMAPVNTMATTLAGVPGIGTVAEKAKTAMSTGIDAARITKYVMGSPTGTGGTGTSTSSTLTSPGGTGTSLTPANTNLTSTIASTDMVNFAKIVAGEVKTALAGVTIKTDSMFGSTALNGPYRIGATT
jgi:hypothetical protein